MTPAKLYSGARRAVKLAHEWERLASEYDRAWHVKCLTEAKRSRERAAYYLRSRRWILEHQPRSMEKAA